MGKLANMPNFSSNDPSSFGWTAPPSQVVPFSFAGHLFPQGLHPLVVPIATAVLTRLRAVQGFSFAPGGVNVAGDWGYQDRMIRGSSGTLSFHAYAIAWDVNAPWNPLGVANPPASPYRVPDVADSIARELGVLWGGSPEFAARPDRMHFEVHLSPTECRQSGSLGPNPTETKPFPLPAGCYYGPLSGPNQSISGLGPNDAPYRPGLRAAQYVLQVTTDGAYGPLTAAATRAFQTRHHLQADGLIGPATWAVLFGH